MKYHKEHLRRKHGLEEETIPSELIERDQWIVADNKKSIRPRAEWNNPEKQFDYLLALEIAEGTGWEPAFVPQSNDPFVVLDFDDVGTLDELAGPIAKFVSQLDTYVEISKSGTGLHVVCRGTHLPDRQVKGELDGLGSVEVFDANQYVVLTGDRVSQTSAITEGGERLIEFQQQTLPERAEDSDHSPGRTKSAGELDFKGLSTEQLSLTPADIHRTIREYATGGMKGAQRALRLWESPAGSSDHYPSASEADLALCSDLAFWCKEDARLMNQCFEDSNRYRDKWAQVRYKDGSTYGEGTIQKAITTNSETYSSDRYVVCE